MAGGDDTEVEYQRFAEFLALPEDFVKEASKSAEDIFKILQSKTAIKIDRCRIIGGFGKKTASSVKADIDAVLFINAQVDGLEDLLDSILEDWRGIILENLEILEEDIKLTARLLKVNYQKIHMVLQPAANLVKDPAHVESSQFQETLKFIKNSKKQFNTGNTMAAELSESSITFIKSKSKIAHDIARLAKFWNQGLIYGETVAGRSLLIETVAIHAVVSGSGEGGQELSYKNCFFRFLVTLMRLETQSIIFLDNYKEEDIPPSIRAQRPLVLDPCNPYNNLLNFKLRRTFYGGVTPNRKFLRFLADCAGATLLKTGGLSEVFRPQFGVKEKWGFLPDRFLTEFVRKDALMPSCRVRRPTSAVRKVESFCTSLAVYLRCKEFANLGMDIRDLKTDFQMKLLNPVMGWVGDWTKATEETRKHEERDVTVMIPLVGQEHSILVSFLLK